MASSSEHSDLKQEGTPSSGGEFPTTDPQAVDEIPHVVHHEPQRTFRRASQFLAGHAPTTNNEGATPEEKWSFNAFEIMFHWFSLPYSILGHILSVDLTGQYREHFVWACDDGDKLVRTVTSRFQSSSVFLSLLVSTTLGVFFNSSTPVQQVRVALLEETYDSVEFATGVVMCISTLCSLGALIANFTAWSIFVVLSKENAAIILRSSLGLYTEQLPNRLVVLAIYLFLVWVGKSVPIT